MFKMHVATDHCRSQEVRDSIDRLIGDWWVSADDSAAQKILEQQMAQVSTCPRCRATLADRVIAHGTIKALADVAQPAGLSAPRVRVTGPCARRSSKRQTLH